MLASSYFVRIVVVDGCKETADQTFGNRKRDVHGVKGGTRERREGFGLLGGSDG